MTSNFEFDIDDQEILEGSIPTVKNIPLKNSKLLSDKGRVKKEDLQYFKLNETHRSLEPHETKNGALCLILTKSIEETNKCTYNIKRIRANSHFGCRKQINKFDSSDILKKLTIRDKEKHYYVTKEIVIIKNSNQICESEKRQASI